MDAHYLSDEDLVEAISQLGIELETQDVRMTSHPIYQVREGNSKQPPVVAQFFTQKAADEYIEEQGHNHGKLHVYVASGYRNPEWQIVREYFMRMSRRGLVPNLGATK